ncbi:MAG: chemotaxis protein CheW [Spirochaetales bacterium]
MTNTTEMIMERRENGKALILDQEGGPVRQIKQDFKMVTFSLGGKDYGIDIMKVKEIAKFTQFTYVPNTPPFVRGVYNLRGEIISIIDLRAFFHLPVSPRQDGVENGLILRLEDYLIGVIVDSIDKVVGIDSEEIQPPHPIFGDINIKYISGVVEYNDTLYLILDVEKLFGKEKEQPPSRSMHLESMEAKGSQSLKAPVKETPPSAQTELDFIRETLRTFKSFHVTPVNDRWLKERFEQWRTERGKDGRDLQIKSIEEAEEFLKTFYSGYTDTLWPDEIAESFLELISEFSGRVFSVWNPGCGKGYETYCMAALFLRKFPDAVLKVWAMDNDLLAISSAPNLLLPESNLPSYLLPYVVKGTQGVGISSQLKERIFFEYHDVLNVNVVPECDLILARDLVSFLAPADQAKVLEEFFEKLKPKGILVLGNHEEPLDAEKWVQLPNRHFSAYRKNTE